MGKYFLIAHSNIRKAKWQTIATVVLVFFAALMLDLWLMLSMDYKRNFDRYHDKLNSGHVTLSVKNGSPEVKQFISETLEKDSRTTQFGVNEAVDATGSFNYNGGNISTEFIFLNKEEAIKNKVERIEIVEEGNQKSGVYLPVIYSTDKDIKAGETISFEIGNRTIDYTICGFTNSVMAGSHNCAFCAMLLTEDKYKELEESGYAEKSYFVPIRIKDKLGSEAFEADIKDKLSKTYPQIYVASNSYALISSSRYISQMICSEVISAMAFFITLIVLVVISSNVTNYIQENMKNIGVLKAEGYVSRQIVSSLMVQFFGIAFITAVSGAGFSYILFPAINTMMVSQTGIPYKTRFLPLPFILAVAIISGTILFVVWFSSRRIKKIEPVVAIRQGIQTHNFKRNPVPLETTKAPLHLALALKTTFSGVKQNIIICITMLVLSLIIVFSGLMVTNMITDMEPFINMVVGETADSSINIKTGSREKFMQIMEDDSNVQKAYLYNSVNVQHKKGSVLAATISDDFSKVNNQDVCIEGRFPKYDNEIALGIKYARQKGLKTGDEIILTADGKEAVYIISGFTQISNNLGKDCLLSSDGYKRMGVLQEENYYINLEDGTDIDKFNKDISRELGDDVINSVNIFAVVQGTGTVYVTLMKIIIAGILVLSLIVIIFVMYLLVRTMLNSKQKDYGIMKAIGYTTRQLMLQTAASFMPAVIISTAAGIAVSSIFINPVVALFLNGIGIVKCTFKISLVFNITAGAGLVLFTFLAACLLSFKIRKNTPRALMAGE
ncbi:MAG: FtsX-like permease family protein [Lachnospiraceae bacterium]|nr:FtsX-like permease family protein [Lachnospiraceae bacterium]